jgi:hypothetical protein
VAYTISINKPNKKCIIHVSNCKSLKQVIGDRLTINQEYIENLKTCNDVKSILSQKNLIGCTSCKKCNPKCP